MPTLEPFADLAARFRAHHNNSLNVALHMITTPAGVLAALILALQRPEISLEVVRGVVGAYVLSLAFILLRGGHLAAFFCTAATMAALTHAATALAPTLSVVDAVKLFAVAYVGQELAHVITGETTFQARSIITLVPIRPRRRGERRFLRTFAGASLRPGSLAFDPRPRRLSTPLLTPFDSAPTTNASYGTPLSPRTCLSGRGPRCCWSTRTTSSHCASTRCSR